MNKLFTKVSTSVSAGLIYLSLATPSFAQISLDPCPTGETEGTDFSALCNLNTDNLGTIISSIVTILLIAAAIIALFFLIWGGIRWILSGGDKVKVDEARKTIVASIIGLIVALLAFFIISVVLGLFHLSLTDLKLPTLT